MSHKHSNKSPLNGTFPIKAPSMEAVKAPSMAEGKAPSYYLPVILMGVVSEDEMKTLLRGKNQKEWASQKRVSGLLMILNYLARNKKSSSMSSELSRQYVSSLKRAKNPDTIRQPLVLLTHLGLVEIAQEAVIAPHRKQSARYRLNPSHGKPRPIQVHLSKQQVEKLANAEPRRQTRLNRKHRTRSQILTDLSLVTLSPAGNELAMAMVSDGEKEQGVKRFTRAMRDTASHKATYDPSGTVTHHVMQCPRELKSHLLLDGKPSAIVDMKAAHLVILLCVGRDRVKWMEANGRDAADLKAEIARYKATLESRDIYEELGGTADRKGFKKTLLSSLNMATSKAIHLPPYQKLKASFPRIVGIIQDLKKNDHRGLSKQLRHFTAKIIESATHEAQRMEIATLPDTDAMIVPSEYERLTRQLLNNAIREVTGLELDSLNP